MSWVSSFIKKIAVGIFEEVVYAGGVSVGEAWRKFQLTNDDLHKALEQALEQTIFTLTVAVKGRRWLVSRVHREYASDFEDNVLNPFFDYAGITEKDKRQEFCNQLLNDLYILKDKVKEILPVNNLREKDVFAILEEIKKDYKEIKANREFEDFLKQRVQKVLDKPDRPLFKLLSFRPIFSDGVIFHFYAILKEDQRVARIYERYSTEKLEAQLDEISRYMTNFSELGECITEIISHFSRLEDLFEKASQRDLEYEQFYTRLERQAEDKYTFIKQIYKGGGGTLYLALNRRLNIKVAIKVLELTGSLLDDRKRHRFAREAKTLAFMSRHPNIVNIYDTGKLDLDKYYMEMEYLEGQDFALWLKCQNDLDRHNWRKAADILHQIASALDFAHKSGIVHRDLKPDNMMIIKDDKVKLLDFGIAKLLNVNTLSLTGEGALGTPTHMAPEQFSPEEYGPIGPWTDIYALGIICYQIFSGKLPFPATEHPTQRLQKKVIPLIAENTAVPQEISDHVEKMMALKPADRYQSVTPIADFFNTYYHDNDPLKIQWLEAKKEKDALDLEQKPLREKLLDTEANNKSLSEQITELSEKLNGLQKELVDYKRELSTSHAQLAGSQKELSDSKAEIKLLESRVIKQEQKGPRSLTIVPLPKIVFFYPLLLISLFCGFGSKIIDISPQACGSIFWAAFVVNFAVVTFKFRGLKPLLLFIAATLIITLLHWLYPVKVLSAGFIAGSSFYIIVATVFATLMITGILANYLWDRWTIEPNRLYHIDSLSGDVQVYPVIDLRVEKEIDDLSEYALLFSGALNLNIPNAPTIHLENVPFIDDVERKIQYIINTK